MASRDDLAGLEADLTAASSTYDAALKVLNQRKLLRGPGIATQQAYVQSCMTAKLRAEVQLAKAKRTGVQ